VSSPTVVLSEQPSIRSRKMAGFSRGAFYAHFNNKEELFFALMQQRASEELAQLRSQRQTDTEEQSLVLIWQLCKKRLRDSQWSLLLIEFKLYVARRGAASVRTTAKLQTRPRVSGSFPAEYCRNKAVSTPCSRHLRMGDASCERTTGLSCRMQRSNR
jgi:AcrR family transcriptional regulator